MRSYPPLVVLGAADLVEVKGDQAQATGAASKAGVLTDESLAQQALAAMLIGQIDGHHRLPSPVRKSEGAQRTRDRCQAWLQQLQTV